MQTTYIELAGIPIEVRSQYNSDFLRDFITDRPPLLKVEPGEEDLDWMRKALQGNYSPSFVENNALHALLVSALLDYNILLMHGSALCMDGEAVIFSAKSGTGKSTHSRLWIENVPGSKLVNDDNPVIRVAEDGSVKVYGSPWSGKTPCYRNVSVPVGAIVRIRRAKYNALTRQSTLESYASVYSSCSGFKADRGMADGQHRMLEHIALNVPCYVLDCLPDEEAARVCASGVRKEEGDE